MWPVRTPRSASAAVLLARATVVATATVAVLAGLTPAAAAPDPPRRDLRGPLPGPVAVATAFDPPARRWLTGHRGVDLAAPVLAVVRAPAAGRVRFAGAVGGRPVLSIEHGAGLRTTYEPVRATVRQGQDVVAGDVLGHVLAGHPGCPVGACLHWGARLAAGGPSGDDDEYVDPLSLLAVDARPIRLKPPRPGDGEV